MGGIRVIRGKEINEAFDRQKKLAKTQFGMWVLGGGGSKYLQRHCTWMS